MKFDFLNSNIYKSTEYAYAHNLRVILPLALLLLIIEIAQSIFDLGSAGFYAAKLIANINVAYAFHTTILLGVTGGKWREYYRKNKSKDRLVSFMGRNFVFAGVAFVIPMILAILLIVAIPGLGGNESKMFFGLSVIVAFVLGLLIYGSMFALFGTMLPALVLGEDASFIAAFHRAKGLFWFVFGRLLFGPVLYLIGLLAFVVLLAKLGFPVNVLTENDRFSMTGIGVSYLLHAAQMFSIGLTATVLCKAYLKSIENAERPA